MPIYTGFNEDITLSKSDCIVNSLGINGDVQGSICKNILKRASSKELSEYIGSLMNQKVLTIHVTDSYNLSCKKIINIVTPFKKSDVDCVLLKQAYRNVISKARELGYKSISFPFIGTGSNGYTKDEAYEAAMAAMDEVAQEEDKLGHDIIAMKLHMYFLKKHDLKRDEREMMARRHQDRILEGEYSNIQFGNNKTWEELCNKGPFDTFNKDHGIPSVDVFKKTKFFNTNQDGLFNEYMAKITRLYAMMTPENIMIPNGSYLDKNGGINYYSLPYDFIKDYLNQTGKDKKELIKNGFDSHDRDDLNKRVRHINRAKLFKIIYNLEMTPAVAMEFLMFNQDALSPSEPVDRFIIDYLLGCFGGVATFSTLCKASMKYNFEIEEILSTKLDDPSKGH